MRTPNWLILALLLGLLLAACQQTTGTGPTVRVDAPASGARIPTGREVEIQSTASDTDQVGAIELYVNGALIREDRAPEGQATFTIVQRWVPSAPGPVQVEVFATDARGTRSTAAAITLEAVGPALVVAEPTSATAPVTATLPTSATESPSETPTVLITTAEVTGTVSADLGVNVRAAPDLTAERIGGIDPSAPATGIARTEASDWVKVRLEDGQTGWVAAEFVRWVGDLTTLPVE